MIFLAILLSTGLITTVFLAFWGFMRGIARLESREMAELGYTDGGK